MVELALTAAQKEQVLAHHLHGLLPESASTFVLAEFTNAAPLFSEELAQAVAFAPRRLLEFTAGRHCARRALAKLGTPPCAIIIGIDREPHWPQSITGSITHCHELCAAAVAPAWALTGLGLDIEIVTRMTPSLWPSVATAGEINWLYSLPEPERNRAATLLFSGKEAWYKCQFPQTRQRVGFHEIELRVESGRFAIVAEPCPSLAVEGRHVHIPELDLVATCFTATPQRPLTATQGGSR